MHPGYSSAGVALRAYTECIHSTPDEVYAYAEYIGSTPDEVWAYTEHILYSGAL